MSQPRQTERVRHVAESLGDLLKTVRVLQGVGVGPRHAWFEVDLTMAQFKTLMMVAGSGGLAGRAIATHLGIVPSAVTPLVDRLVQHGYVKREEDAEDRRITWIRPTERGVAVYERISVASRELLEEIVAMLPNAELDIVERGVALLRAATERRLAERGQVGAAPAMSPAARQEQG